MSRILLIEDDPGVASLLQRILVGAGYVVVEAGNGKAGLASYFEQPTDLVITDIVMPDIEGLEVIRALRRHDARVKIIAMSGGGVGEANIYLDMARNFEARWVLNRPFSKSGVLAVVAEALASPATIATP